MAKKQKGLKITWLDKKIYKGTRIIGGKKFYLYQTRLSKRDAESRKAELKADGRLTRSVKKPSGYEVWGSQRRYRI